MTGSSTAWRPSWITGRTPPGFWSGPTWPPAPPAAPCASSSVARHQAIQPALADMATKVGAARLLVYDAAGDDVDDARVGMAKVYASETAYEVTLDSMRVHGGYGYTSEFPVERYYRDAARLASTPTTNAADRAEVARRLTARGPADDESGLAR